MKEKKLPWAGFGALLLAAVGAVLLLRSGVQLSSWNLTRASGLIAYVLLWLSLCLGMLQSTAFLKGAASPLGTVDLHNFTALWAIYGTVFHAVILLWDRYITFTPAEILIPFASHYKPFWIGIGSVAFYVSLLVTISTYLRSRFSPQQWRTLHLLSLPAFFLALIHGVALGTDSHHPAVAFMYRFTGISVAALIGYRLYLGVSKRASSPGRR